MNCPNCNANEIINGRCQYCGTFFPEQEEYIRFPRMIKEEQLDEIVRQIKKCRSVLI